MYVTFVKVPKRAEAAAVAWAIGWAVVNVSAFSLNQFAAVKVDSTFFAVASVALGTPAVGLLASRREKLRVLLQGPALPQELRHGIGLVSLCSLGIFVGLVFYKGLTIPPASTDAIVYHMQLPKLALQTGFMTAEPGTGWLELVSSLPNLLVTQQLWVYLGAGEFNEVLVRPIMPIYTSLLLLLTFSDSRRWFGIFPAFLAAAGLYSLNEFASLTIVMWAEVPVAFYAYLAIRTVLWSSDRWTTPFVAGFFAGASALAKYNGLVVVLALAAAIPLLAVWNQGGKPATNFLRSLRQGGVRAGCFLLVAGLMTAPLLLRNAIAFGNPVYPFFFGGVNTGPLAYYEADFSARDFTRFYVHKIIVLIGSLLIAGIAIGMLRLRQWSTAERFLFVVLVFYLPIYAYFTSAGSHVRYFAPMIPVAAILGGRQLAWWIAEANRRDQFRGCLVVSGLVGAELLFLATTDVQPPYLVQFATTFIALSVLAVFLVAMQGRSPRTTVRTAAAVGLAIALLVPGYLAVAGERYPPREAILDVTLIPPDREAYLEARFGDDWRMWKWINANLPRNALILTFEPRLLYLERSVIFAADHELDPTYSMTLDQAVAFVRGLGVQYVLDSPWSRIPIVNQIFLRRSVVFQNLSNQAFFTLVHAEGDTKVYTFAGQP